MTERPSEKNNPDSKNKPQSHQEGELFSIDNYLHKQEYLAAEQHEAVQSKADAKEALNTNPDWISKSPKDYKKNPDTKGNYADSFGRPVDAHVVYESDIFGVDSGRAVVRLMGDLGRDLFAFIGDPMGEIRRTNEYLKLV